MALSIGCLLVALSLVCYKHTHLLTGGTTGLAFLVHYLSGWPLGAVLFVVNLPFYLFGWLAMGKAFTLKTFGAVLGLSILAEWTPHWVGFETLNPVYAAVMSGLLAGTGILILIRHGASLGGLGVLFLYLQKRRGWRAGKLQMGSDVVILSLGLAALPWDRVGLSLLSALALNLVIAVNHRPDRYAGF